MNVLVTGGAGYIGSHVVHELLKEKINVTILDNLSTSCKENINKDVNFIYGDILNESILNKTIKEHKIEAVIHLAALKAAGESMINPSKYLNNNLIGSSKLIMSCQKNNIDKIIFSSSAAVYGEPKENPITEFHSTMPTNFYGETKLQIERYLEWYKKLHKINYVSLRYFNAAGYNQNGILKKVDYNPQNLIPIIMEVLTNKRKVLEVFGIDYNTNDGTAIRDYVHVVDLAKAHVKSLNYLNNYKKSNIFNLGSKTGLSVFDIMNESQRVSGKNINYVIKDRRPGDCEKMIADFRKANKILKWSPKYSDISSIIDSSWKMYKSK